MTGKSWRCPISKSSVSCAGVTFRTPVPNSGSIASSAMIGIFSRASGRQACLPNKSTVTLVVRMYRDSRVSHDGFGPRGGDFNVTLASGLRPTRKRDARATFVYNPRSERNTNVLSAAC